MEVGLRASILGSVLVLLGAPAFSAVTLKCDAEERCDGYIKNCVADPYSLTVHIEPEKRGGHCRQQGDQSRLLESRRGIVPLRDVHSNDQPL
jgi:hypothetical protein